MTTPLTLLRQLGNDKKQVAINLAALDCRGERDDCMACPVAVYLLRSELSPLHVMVDILEAELFYPGGGSEIVALPTAIADFIAGFDTGEYDQLLRPVTA